MQPFLGAICPILIVSNFRLEVIYLVLGSSKLIVGSSKLIRKFLSELSCLLEVCHSRVGRPVNQSENCIRCLVHYIGF